MKTLRTIFAALTISLWIAPAAAQAADDELAFTRSFADQFRAAMSDRQFEIAAPLQIRDQSGALYNVGRIFNFCRTSPPEECESARATFISGLREAYALADRPVVREQLRLAVRHQDFCDYLTPTDPANPAPIIAMRPVGPELCAIMMIDFPASMRSASSDDLAALGLDADAAWAIAERQTLAALPNLGAFAGLGEGMILVSEFDYIPSLMLAHDLWRELTARHGALVVAVPEDSMLAAVRRTGDLDLVALRRTTREIHETGERGISPLLYTWTPEGWRQID